VECDFFGGRFTVIIRALSACLFFSLSLLGEWRERLDRVDSVHYLYESVFYLYKLYTTRTKMNIIIAHSSRLCLPSLGGMLRR
jgi:hypothetical protein